MRITDERNGSDVIDVYINIVHLQHIYRKATVICMELSSLYLGIEIGSTRIKAVLIDEKHVPVASGNFTWENTLQNGYWTYSEESVWNGVQSAYHALAVDFERKYQTELTTLGGIGISAMMHGYLPLNKEGNLLVPFRTWRNTATGEAAKALSELFRFNIPERWSIAHLYQAILNGEEHVREIDFLTTLAGYVHFKLTGEKLLGVGDASGMFPVDGADYCADMLKRFDSLIENQNYAWSLRNILPQVCSAGECAGKLTTAGANLLDPTGKLQAGIPFCPPEGDAETGMVATNSVAVRTGNVSAGTSVFAMIVLERELKGVYREIDIVTTPDGKPVAMVHCNNCTSDIDAWVKLFGEVLSLFGVDVKKSVLYDTMYQISRKAEKDCGGLVSYNYYGGEPITGIEQGRPLFVRMPDGRMTAANVMRSLLYSSVASLKIGMDILLEKEKIVLERIAGHGGLFKTEGIGQRMIASALGVPVSVSASAGEGGAWGIAVLAAYTALKEQNEDLGTYLENRVFANDICKTEQPDAEEMRSFAEYIQRYKAGLAVERAAGENLKG